MKTNKKQGWFYQASTKVELLLGASFFPLPVLRNSAATEKMISPVYTTHNSIVGLMFQKEASIPMNKSKYLKEIIHLPCHLDRRELPAHSRSVVGQTLPLQV